LPTFLALSTKPNIISQVGTERRLAPTFQPAGRLSQQPQCYQCHGPIHEDLTMYLRVMEQCQISLH
jgi:hypothetical protein